MLFSLLDCGIYRKKDNFETMQLNYWFKSFLFCLTYFTLNAQSFQKTFTASGIDHAHGIVNTADGGFAVTGYTNSFGQGGNDLFLMKIDNLGNVLWQKTYGSSGQEDGMSVAITETPDQGFVIVGATTGFGAIGMDVLVVRVDPSGSVLWSGKYNTPSDHEFARGVIVASNGDVVIAGTDNQNGSGSADGLIMRLSGNGNLLWSRLYGGNLNDHFHSLHELPGGNILISGSSSTFGPGSTAGYVLKINPQGNILWDYTYGTSGTNAFNSSALTDDFKLLCAGFSDSYGGGSQVLVTKIDTNGNVIGSTVFGGNNYERAASIKRIPNGTDFYVASNTQSYGNGGKEMLVSRFSANGNHLWSKTVGTSLIDEFDSWAHNTLISLDDGGYAFVGWSNGTGSGGDNLFFGRSDSNGSLMCNQVTPTVSSPTISRLNPASSILNTGTYSLISTIATNAFFTSNNACLCPITPLFNVVPNLCVNDTPPVLATTSNNGVSGTWNPSLINTNNAGTFTYTFTPNTGQCASPVNTIINITQLAGPLVFNPIGPFCLNDVASSLPTTDLNGITGIWNPPIINTSISGTNSYLFTPDAGQCASSTNLNINVLPLGNTPIFNSIGPFCQNEITGSLPVTSINGISGSWFPSLINTAVPGTYSYTFSPDPNECAPSTSIFITVNPSANPLFFDPFGPFCQNEFANPLPNSDNNGISGSWNPPSINTSFSGNYTYTFTPDAGQCASISDVIIDVIPAGGLPEFSQIGPFCENTVPLELPLTDQNGMTGSWSPANINTAIVGNANYIFTPDIDQCGLETTISINIVPNPTVNFSADTLIGCSNLNVQFSGNTDLGTEFLWFFGDGDSLIGTNVVDHNYTNEGCFDVILIVTEATNGCSSQHQNSDYICILPEPIAQFQVSSESGCDPLSIHFVNLSQNATSFQWIFNPGDTIITTSQVDFEQSFIEATSIELVAMNELGCMDSFSNNLFVYHCGCMDSLALNFDPIAAFDDGSCIYAEPFIFIPNVFTPNSDGANDFFELDTELVSELELVILNRWGNVMFEESGIDPKWDGKFLGKDCTEGTYFFKYHVIGIDGSEYTGHGFLMLER